MDRVFVTRSLPGRAIELLSSAGLDVDQWTEELPPPPARLAQHALGATAVLALLTDRFDARLLGRCPRLRIVANMAVGFDNVDVESAAAQGIWVSNTPGVLAETTADFAFALLLAAARRVAEGDRDVRAGKWKTWSPTGHLGVDIHGARLGIVGLGETGQAMVRRAAGFGMEILYSSRTRRHELEEPLGLRWLPFDRVMEESDFISLHVPYNSETRHLVGAPEFERMKSTAILINTSRGAVVDQAALVEALRGGQLGGAALDVTDPEPMAARDPLLKFPNVIVTPHIASASVATRSRMAEMAARNILAVMRGDVPPNPVNRPAAPRGA